MTTLAVNLAKKDTGETELFPLWKKVKVWLLMLPFIFLSGGGQFSFQRSVGSGLASDSLAGLNAARNTGLVDRIILPGLAYSVILWFVLANIKGVANKIWEMKLFSCLAVLAVLSFAWSQNPERSLSYGSFYLLDTLFAFALASRFTTEELMSLIKMTGVSVAIAGLFIVIFFPRWGVGYDGARGFGSWVGLFTDRTAAAKITLFLLTPAIVFDPRQFSRSRCLYIGLVGLMLVEAKAVTSIVILLAYIVTMAAIQASRRLERRATVAISSAIVLVSLFTIALVLADLQDLLHFFGRDLTLTGRTDIWAALLPSIAKRPLLGYGFYSFWMGLKGESANAIITVHWVFGYAHNGLIEIVLQLGFMGLALVLITLCQALLRGFSCIKRGSSITENWCLGFIVVTILYNVDESTIMWPHSLLSILYIVVCCKLAQIHRERSGPTLQAIHNWSR